MRLYLSSFRVGDHAEVLLRLARRGVTGVPRALVVANALDALPAAERRQRVDQEGERLHLVGLEPTELDLRDHAADDTAALDAALAGCQLLWLRGGNVFVLRHALAMSGLDRLLPRLLAGDALVVGGYSAGPCVLGSDLAELAACDPPDEVPALYEVAARTDGLGILPVPVVPHLDTPDHFESAVLEQVAQRHRSAGRDHLGLRDGDVFVVDGAVSDGRILPRRR